MVLSSSEGLFDSGIRKLTPPQWHCALNAGFPMWSVSAGDRAGAGMGKSGSSLAGIQLSRPGSQVAKEATPGGA